MKIISGFTNKVMRNGLRNIFFVTSFCLTQMAFGQSPVWNSADQKNNNGQSTNASVQKPSNLTAGDLILIIATTQRSPNAGSTVSSFSTPAGFTLIRAEHNAGTTDAPEVVGFYKIAGASEPANYTSIVTDFGDEPRWKCCLVV